MDITTTATAEKLAETKTVREIFKLATDQDVDGFDSLLNKYGLWSVLRIGGWVARFVHNTRRPPRERKTGPLTTEEVSIQRRFWEKRAQQEGVKSKAYENDRSQLNLPETTNNSLNAGEGYRASTQCISQIRSSWKKLMNLLYTEGRS